MVLDIGAIPGGSLTDRRAESMHGRLAEPVTWTKTNRVVFAGFVVSVFASLAWIVHPWFDVSVDASIYIITARSLAAGEGYAYLGEPFLLRPPGFPVLLAPILATVGTDFLALNFFVALCGAAGVVLLFFFERPRLGFGLALLVALAVWLNPGYQRLTTQVMSDVPGATLMLACLLVERWARAAPSGRREVVLGLCVGLSTYVRSALVLLVPAIALSRLLLRDRARDPSWLRFAARQWLPFAAVALLVLAPWSIRDRLHATSDPAEQTLFHSYGVAMSHVDPADPGSPLLGPAEILGRIPTRVRQVTEVLADRMKNDRGNFEPRDAFPPAQVAFALCVLGSSWVVLWRRREPAELFVLASLFVIVTYFGFGSRLLLPVYLLSLPAAVEILRELAVRGVGSRAGELVAAVIVLQLIALDFEPRRSWTEIEREHREYVEFSRAIASAVGPDERLGTAMGAPYSVFLERPVYSLHHAARRSDSVDAAERIIERHHLDAIALSSETPFQRALASYLRGQYGAPERVGPALVWRIPK